MRSVEGKSGGVMSRRDLLRASVLGAGGLATAGLLAACEGKQSASVPAGDRSSIGPSSSATPLEIPSGIPDAVDGKVKGFFRPAFRYPNGEYRLFDSDNGAKQMAVPDSFTPDESLRLPTGKADIDMKVQTLEKSVPQGAGDFQAYLNSFNNPTGKKLAGYAYGTNDYNQYGDHGATPQLPAYGWLVHTGLTVSVPGIGEVQGGPGRAAMVLVVNRTPDVFRWPDDHPVEVKAGFQGAGRIWNGDAPEASEAERRLVDHYRFNLGSANPESGLVGQCDQGNNNCDSLTVVTAERVQWGNNPDGTPRYQFRLLRAEEVSTK